MGLWYFPEIVAVLLVFNTIIALPIPNLPAAGSLWLLYSYGWILNPDKPFHRGPGFHKTACNSLEPYILANGLVGQDSSIQIVSDLMCMHMMEQNPSKPLVIALHGSFGVGKSMMYHLAADALHNKSVHLNDAPVLRLHALSEFANDPEQYPIVKSKQEGDKVVNCGPGRSGKDCPSFKEMRGLNFVGLSASVGERHLKAAWKELVNHLKKAPAGQSLIVFSDYDKWDCQTRRYFAKVFRGGELIQEKWSMNKCIIILESNEGRLELAKLAGELGATRGAPAIKASGAKLKKIFIRNWEDLALEQKCHTNQESANVEAIKTSNAIDHYVGFFPFRRADAKKVMTLWLNKYSQELSEYFHGILEWDHNVVDFLVNQMTFDPVYTDFAKSGGADAKKAIKAFLYGPVKKLALQLHRTPRHRRSHKWKLTVAPDKSELVVVHASNDESSTGRRSNAYHDEF